MRLTAMSYNLMRVFEEISKTQQPELIHPSDKKYSEALEIRQQQAQKRDRFVNPSLKIMETELSEVVIFSP
ncbi:hypothetical protein [Bathymodiolus japonicus methanotrophic gill symbiont]|uniref:hypothetical protein n=1 Tax=Bathymodiolus japonicus methanotrophic gill symbiont TaxID=113269 RepID=UPI001C8D2B00|nr:hypothetical protein [Bathymodiolus japonicus methanotrophic gill symbiont]